MRPGGLVRRQLFGQKAERFSAAEVEAAFVSISKRRRPPAPEPGGVAKQQDVTVDWVWPLTTSNTA